MPEISGAEIIETENEAQLGIGRASVFRIRQNADSEHALVVTLPAAVMERQPRRAASITAMSILFMQMRVGRAHDLPTRPAGLQQQSTIVVRPEFLEYRLWKSAAARNRRELGLRSRAGRNFNP
ncbi:hypothetical protein [Mesorhizobium sp.]|uniref:hypothetical protein n=1 Tax=Mesorhizobium sp. TaxID=1871066 RepID=UPI000FE9BE2F|nr:hypothetical protein [Mesorhizobium sp.]RWP35302.1 MAG: hypothetical protein EOR03_13040 [Mesorhizobium sp.]